MPDISMCMRGDCAVASLCRRHEASGTEPSRWQSWFAPANPGPDCISFWPVSPAAERLAGAMPASLHFPDAPAAPPAGVSITRPIGDHAPGATTTGTGAILS